MSGPSGVLRLASEADAAALAAIYAPYVEGSAVSFEARAPDAAELARRLRARGPAHPTLLLEEAGEVRAFAYAGPHRARAGYRWTVETSVYVRPDQHRRGHGRRLYEALIPLLIRQGYVTAYAGIALPNPGSVGLHEAVGFRYLGTFHRAGFKLGRWHDTGWWERELAVVAPGEEPPLPRVPRPEDLRAVGVA